MKLIATLTTLITSLTLVASGNFTIGNPEGTIKCREGENQTFEHVFATEEAFVVVVKDIENPHRKAVLIYEKEEFDKYTIVGELEGSEDASLATTEAYPLFSVTRRFDSYSCHGFKPAE